MAERHAPNSPVTLEFDYVKDGVKTNRVVYFEHSLFQESGGGKAYNRGKTLFVDGMPPKHPYSTYYFDCMENVKECVVVDRVHAFGRRM